MNRLYIRDAQLADLQLSGAYVQLDLTPDCQRPAPGDLIVTESSGSWEVLRVLSRADGQLGASLVADLR